MAKKTPTTPNVTVDTPANKCPNCGSSNCDSKCPDCGSCCHQASNEVLEMDFIICDESVNRYGWRLLVGGIDTTGFAKNPVCCVQHNTLSCSIGKWKNFRVEDSKFVGTLEFDPNDDVAVLYYNKYKNGYMNAVSLSVIPIETSDDPKLMIAGQTDSTLTKCDLLEVSVVTVPGQKNAVVKLFNVDGSEYKLNLKQLTNPTMSKESEKTVEQLQQELQVSRKLNAENLVQLHKARGVVQDPEVESLQALALENYDTVQKMLDARTVVPKTDEGTANASAKNLVELHADRIGLTVDEKKMYENAAKTDYDGTKKALESRKGKEAIQGLFNGTQLGGDATGGEDRSKWSYLDFYKKDKEALDLMAKNEPEKYNALELAFVNESKKKGITTQREQ